MERNEPSAKCLCCYLHPNTILAGWAALKIIMDVGLTAFILYCLFLVNTFHPFHEDSFTITAIVSAILSVIDIVMMGILSNAIDQKNVETLKAVYYYCFYLLTLGSAFVIGIFVFVVSKLDQFGINASDVLIIFIIFFNVGLVVRIILLLRSEIKRMQGLNMLINSPPLKQKESSTKKPFHSDEENNIV